MPPLHPRPLPPPGIRAPRPGSASLAGRRRGPPRPPPGWPASDRARRAPSRCWGAAASWARTCPVSPRLRVAGDRWAGVTVSTRGLRANTPPPHEGLERLPRPPTPRVTVRVHGPCTRPAWVGYGTGHVGGRHRREAALEGCSGSPAGPRHLRRGGGTRGSRPRRRRRRAFQEAGAPPPCGSREPPAPEVNYPRGVAGAPRVRPRPQRRARGRHG